MIDIAEMRSVSRRQILNLTLLLLITALFLNSCFKVGPRPANTPVSTAARADSIAKADTLPTFYAPTGIALDVAGNIYIADYGNDLIRKITPAGIVSTYAGSGMQGSLNGSATIASFNQPAGIALDVSGNLYVADAGNNAIRKITPAGVVSQFAGTDSTGMADGPAATATFFGPAGVAVDATNNVYVADAGNNLIRMVSASGTVSTIAGLNGEFANPTGIAINSKGNLFVANYLDNTIMQIISGTISVYAGSGQQGATNGSAAASSFYFPNNVAVDAAGNVYVADGVNNLIREITPGGIVSTLAGSGVAGSADGTGTSASFNGPSGLVVNAQGTVYVTDTNNNLIRKITAAGVVTTIAGTGAAGSRNGKAFARHGIIIANSATRLNIWHRSAVQ